MTQHKSKKKWKKRDWLDLALILICIPILILGFAVSLSVYKTKQSGGVTTILGYCFLTVQTGSMEPELLVGDTFVSKSVSPSKIKKGDIISFYDGKKIVTHKVDSVIINNDDPTKEQYYFVTYGINNKKSNGEYKLDDYIVPGSQLVGRYKGHSKFNGFAGFLTSKWGMFCFVIVPLGVLIITDIFSLVSYIGPKKPKQTDLNADSFDSITPVDADNSGFKQVNISPKTLKRKSFGQRFTINYHYDKKATDDITNDSANDSSNGIINDSTDST